MPGFVNPRADDRSPARHPQFRQSSPSTSARPFGLTKRELDLGLGGLWRDRGRIAGPTFLSAQPVAMSVTSGR
jgi:hypothetical protein